MNLLDYIQANWPTGQQKVLRPIKAYGTSEGVKKGWEVRDRRGITEFYPGSKGNGTKTTYSGGASHDVIVTETARRARVEEHGWRDGSGYMTTVHDGTPKSAKDFVKQKYGIDHGGAKQ